MQSLRKSSRAEISSAKLKTATDWLGCSHRGFSPQTAHVGLDWALICPQTSPSAPNIQRKPKSRPTPTLQREARLGQTPTTASVLGPRPLPTSDHIIWDKAGLSLPSSVQVRPQTPTMRGGGANYPSKRWGTIEMWVSKKWLENKKDTYTYYTINGRKLWWIIVLLKRHLVEKVKNKLVWKEVKLIFLLALLEKW